jgi:subtilisin family serine protease
MTDDQGYPSQSWLFPLTPKQQQEYASTREELKGFVDLRNGIDSPEAKALREKLSASSPDQMRDLLKTLDLISGLYMHGTHVAGIMMRGNPAARLVIIRFDDGLVEIPFQPTLEWAHRMAADFQQISDYFRTRNVRVVNMSWSDDPQEFELWLSKTSNETDPVVRKNQATELYSIWRAAIESAIKRAPNTLFVCAAGNSDSDAAFAQDAPAGLHLPNLIAVGAVNQAGDETDFTSYGNTVVVDADGYEVESFVPGGGTIKMSGTSMASPNVANLAAKLFALDPSLMPEQVIELIEKGATTSDDGRRHLIDPKRSIALLQARN